MQEEQTIDSSGKDAGKTRETIDAALRQLLNGQDAAPGSKLPTERALSEQFKVSRNVIRSALGRLEAEGRIVRIIGSGTYVAKAKVEVPPEVAQSAGDASPGEIMETRLLVEPALAALVVAHANSQDLDTIRSAMENGIAARDFFEFEIWDGRFHQAIADATHNRLMIDLYRRITLSRDLAEWGEMKRRSINEERRQLYNKQHRDIVVALQARDGEKATNALRAHLITVRQNLLGY